MLKRYITNTNDGLKNKTQYSMWPRGQFTPTYAWEKDLGALPQHLKNQDLMQRKTASLPSAHHQPQITESTNHRTNSDKSELVRTDSELNIINKKVPNVDALHRCFIWRCFDEYCDNTSVHGLKYVTQEEYYCVERIAWAILCASAWIAMVFFVKPTFDRYLESPMFTAIESTNEPIYNVDFPGVTICNINKADKFVVENISKEERWKKYTSKAMHQLIDYMVRLYEVVELDEPEIDLNELQKIINGEEAHVDALMKRIIQPLNRMALRCWWMGHEINCSGLFHIIRTDEGYCWSFNSKTMKDLTTQGTLAPSHESVKHAEYETLNTHYIRRVNGAGSNMGLIVLLNPDRDRYFATTNELIGFKVLVHHPYDFPSVSAKAFLVSPGREVYGEVSVSKVNSSDDVRTLNMNSRDCRFENEKNLSMYSEYSYQNCLLECRVQSMNATCGCVPYLYSALREYKICEFQGAKCIHENIGKFQSIEAEKGIQGIDYTLGSMSKCDCLSNCDYTDYSVYVSTGRFPRSISPVKLANKTFPADLHQDDLVLLRIFFKELFFVKYRRDLTYNWERFVASFGGLVSLFEGFSLISGVELIYFFTIRPFFRWIDERRDRKAAEAALAAEAAAE